jgi:hypothetical protein
MWRLARAIHTYAYTVCTEMFGSSEINLRTIIIKIGQNHIHTVIHASFGWEISKYTVIYGVYLEFWPSLSICIMQQHLYHADTATCNVCRVGQNRIFTSYMTVYLEFWPSLVITICNYRASTLTS